jgi:uncharacterized protein (TIGR02217 family)
MSGFHEVRFPDNIAYGATGGPEFATTVVATGAGHEKRNVNWRPPSTAVFDEVAAAS